MPDRAANRSPVTAALRAALGILLLVAGVLKIGHAAALAAAIAGFRLLPAAPIPYLALLLPWFEALLGLYLALGLFTRVAAAIAALAFAAYAGAIASAVLRGIPAQCGCFGPNDPATANWPHAGFDLGLSLIALYVAWRAPGALALDRRIVRS